MSRLASLALLFATGVEHDLPIAIAVGLARRGPLPELRVRRGFWSATALERLALAAALSGARLVYEDGTLLVDE